MGIHAHTREKNETKAVNEIAALLGGDTKGLLVYFASSAYDHAKLAAAFEAQFPGRAIGCSTAGELCSEHMGEGGMVAMLLGPDLVEDFAVAVVEHAGDKASLTAAFRTIEAHFGQKMAHMSFEYHVGLVLVDGLSMAEEKLMENIGDATNVLFVGGSAGDDLRFEATYVSAGGRTYRNAAVLAVLYPKAPFRVVKNQSFRSTGVKLTITKADPNLRIVHEFNGAPAALAYADALKVPLSRLPELFMSNPVGIMVNGEPFVRSPQRLEGDSVVFYCNMMEGMTVEVLKASDIVEDTRAALTEVSGTMGGVSAIVNFNCILRALDLQRKGQVDTYRKLFKDMPTIGFSTYGEEYIGHTNQTSTMLVFGKTQ